jgi:hypothetical protein
VEDPRQADFYLVNNLTGRSVRFVRKYCTPQNSALLIWESDVTCPRNFRNKLHRYFKVILAPSHIWSARVSGIAFYWPQNNPLAFAEYTNNSSSHRIDKWVMVQSKKYSFMKNEMYSLRNRILSEKEHEIDLWGYGWNSKSSKNLIKTFLKDKSIDFSKLIHNYNFNRRILQNYRGETSNKIQTMTCYRFALVIENSADYVSEKLVDAVIAGTIPVYVGPKLENFGIPSNVAVISHPHIAELGQKMREIEGNRDLQEQILRAGTAFLHSNKFQSMINTRVFANIGNILCQELFT